MDNRFWKIIAVMAVIVTASILVAGCASPAPQGKTIVDLVFGDPVSLDPQLEYDSASYAIMQNVYETLVYYEGKDVSKPVGVLAESWTSNDDYTVWTFYLRDGVKFHDGTAFNASAVKYTFDRGVLINYPDGPFVGAGITSFLKGGDAWLESNHTQADADAYLANEAVKVINETTVQFTLSKSYPDLYHVMAFPATSIVSPSYDQANGGYKINNWTDTYLKEHMCGTGPFKFVSWAHEDNIVLDRNNDYWREPAKVERVVIRNVPEVSNRVLAMEKGEADLIQENMGNYEVYQNLTNAKSVIDNDTLVMSFIGLYQGKAPFNNKDVRQAFVESFDYETYREKVGFGYGAFPHGVVPKGLATYNENIPVYQFNPTHAKQLLEQAGFSKDKPTKIVLAYNEGNTGREIGATMLRDQIKSYDLGIDVDVQPYTWATLLDKQKKGELDMFFLGWQADFPTPDNFLGPFAVSDVYFAKQVKYVNETIDQLFKQYFTVKTQAERQQISDQIQLGLLNDYAYLIYLQPAEISIVSNSVTGFERNIMDSGHNYYKLDKV